MVELFQTVLNILHWLLAIAVLTSSITMLWMGYYFIDTGDLWQYPLSSILLVAGTLLCWLPVAWLTHLAGADTPWRTAFWLLLLGAALNRLFINFWVYVMYLDHQWGKSLNSFFYGGTSIIAFAVLVLSAINIF